MGRVRKLFETTQNSRALKRWDERVKIAENLSLSELRELRSETRQLQSRLNRINHIANSRLALPVIGSRAFKKPPKTDWTHRPQAWNGPVHPTGIASATTKSRLGDDLSIYHDCERSEMTIRQVRNNKEEDLSPFGIRLDVFRFYRLVPIIGYRNAKRCGARSETKSPFASKYHCGQRKIT